MKHFCIIGNPVKQSASAEWFGHYFKEKRLDATFEMIEPSTDIFFDFHAWIKARNLDGLLITLPFKKGVLDCLDVLDTHAKAIGAVNTVAVNDKKLVGFNTDYIAFESEILRLRPQGYKKVLVFGMGGAAEAVVYALKRNNIPYQKVSRRKVNGSILYNELTAAELAEADLLVNATPLGMGKLESECPAIDYAGINKNALAFDLIYFPAETVFMKKCAEAGCETSNGRGMVEFVYEKALELWNI